MNDINGLFGHLLRAGGARRQSPEPRAAATARTAVAEFPPREGDAIDALERSLDQLTVEIDTARASVYDPMFEDNQRFNRWWKAAHEIWMNFDIALSPLAHDLRVQLNRIDAARQAYAEAYCRVAETLFSAGNVTEIVGTVADARRAASAGRTETVRDLAWHARAEIEIRVTLLSDTMYAFVAYQPVKMDLLEAFLAFDRLTAAAAAYEPTVVC